MPPRPPRYTREDAPLSLWDDPAAIFLAAGAIVAAALLVLRHVGLAPGQAEAVARELVILAGPAGCALAITVLTVTLCVPLIGMGHPALAPFREAGTRLFDEAVTHTMALSAAAGLAALVAMGRPAFPAAWFLFQALIAWGCHRLRRSALAA